VPEQVSAFDSSVAAGTLNNLVPSACCHSWIRELLRSIASFDYDLADGTKHIHLNARNGLASIGDGSTTTASFVYDGLGRRAGKTLAGAATEFLYDGLNPVQEISGGTRARTC
jgi:YD repeat-containing protein